MFFTCLTIFLARIVDVSISTLRTMIMVRKRSIIIPILAFFEVFIWFIAARRALNTNIKNLMIPIFYSLGYATGTYIGGLLSHRFIKDINTIEVTTKRNNTKLINYLRKNGYSISILGLKNSYDLAKDMIIIDVKRSSTNKLMDQIKKIDPDAFIVVRDTRVVYNGYIK